ncbi:hypothetical protein Clacol_001410 [Clathrus columnatus]|uniref:RRM domain-containing protein n=1 Tax=Clathrus columnatus TaxID=1419009 RepID=A0AAV5A5N8_9AGAM|nr:hypothetical protein Clacol_001410 [Clathrus columnatus]
MNVVREINKINDVELKFGSTSASWHDDYKDYGLTEGDVIVIFSQYGEVMDVNMPRDKNTGKPKGFAFLMYEDQRSTVLAVDNLGGANVLGRTLKVDHVRSYKQPKVRNEEGELVDPEEQALNAKPELVHGKQIISIFDQHLPLLLDDDAVSESSESSAPSIDPEDPMREYLLQKRREEKEKKKKKSKDKDKQKRKSKHINETLEERRARKERKKSKKALKDRERSNEKPERNHTPPYKNPGREERSRLEHSAERGYR